MHWGDPWVAPTGDEPEASHATGKDRRSREPVGATHGSPPGTILSALRPDYRRYIGEMRPMEMNGLIEPAMRAIYMALVKPGATDPTRRESAPFTGPNDSRRAATRAIAEPPWYSGPLMSCPVP